MPNRDFLIRAVRTLYSDVIHLFDWKSAVEHDGGEEERTVTGILVREILVRGTKIFSGKLVRPDRFFREKWSASGKLVRIMVRP